MVGNGEIFPMFFCSAIVVLCFAHNFYRSETGLVDGFKLSVGLVEPINLNIF